MSRLRSLKVQKFRSIESAEIEFPVGMPVVLFGQNNAGKSNIVKGLSIILGEQYPRYYQPEENDYFLRSLSEPMTIIAEFAEDEALADRYVALHWKHDRQAGADQTTFLGVEKSGVANKWIKSEEREDCMLVMVEAERNLKYQLSYTSKFTMLSRLMHRFHQKLHAYENIRQQLETEFKETKELFNQIPEFHEFCETLRGDVDSTLKCWTYKLELDFEAYNPLNFFHSVRVQAKEGENIRPFEELGTGEQQILAISFGHAYARAFKKGFVLGIEEPEVHLHPLAQAWLAERIRVMCADGLQVILSTHSPSFLDLMNLPGMHLIYREGSITQVLRHDQQTLTSYCLKQGANSSKCSSETILPFYAANTTPQLLEGFFARAVVLVEGATEALALPIYLAFQGCNTKELGIAVIPVHGKGSIARYVRLFEAYKIPTYVVFDNDPSDDESGEHRKDIFRTVSQPLDDSNFESKDIIVEDSFAIFGEDFEKSLRKLLEPVGYGATEEEVRDKYGPAKPIVARQVAIELTSNGIQHGCWEKLRVLAQKIRAKVPNG